MNEKATHMNWREELGATSRGMMFLGGSFATPQSLQAADAQARERGGQRGGAGPGGFVVAVLAAALMLAPVLASLADDAGSVTRANQRIVDLPTVTVRPSAPDAAAYRHSRRIVELDTVVVRPREVDRAHFLAKRESRPQSLASIATRP